MPEVVEVAAGPFLMGSDKAADGRAYGDEEPQHEQPMPEAYAIGKYPVTVGQYGRFVEDGGYTEKWRNCWTNAGWRQRERKNGQHRAIGMIRSGRYPTIRWWG